MPVVTRITASCKATKAPEVQTEKKLYQNTKTGAVVSLDAYWLYQPVVCERKVIIAGFPDAKRHFDGRFDTAFVRDNPSAPWRVYGSTERRTESVELSSRTLTHAEYEALPNLKAQEAQKEEDKALAAAGPNPWKAGDRVEVNWKQGGTWYTAKVEDVKGPRIFVRYDSDHSTEGCAFTLARKSTKAPPAKAATAVAQVGETRIFVRYESDNSTGWTGLEIVRAPQ